MNDLPAYLAIIAVGLLFLAPSLAALVADQIGGVPPREVEGETRTRG